MCCRVDREKQGLGSQTSHDAPENASCHVTLCGQSVIMEAVKVELI